MQPNSNTADKNSHLCALGMLLLFVGCAGYFGIKLAESRIEKTAQWPKVTGRIITSTTSVAVVKTGPVRRATDVATIEYVFSVDGREFKSDGRRILPMLHFNPEGTPEEIVRRYPLGRSVDVYYDPANPSDALLTPVPGEDARSMIRSCGFIAPCVALVGLLLAGIGGMNRLRGPCPTALNPVPQVNLVRPERVTSPPPAPVKPVQPRTTHWLVRGVAVLFGLFLMLFGGPLSVTIARMSDPKVSVAVHIISLVMVGGAGLFGALLVYIGMRKPRQGRTAGA